MLPKRTIWQAFRYAWRGFAYTWRSQPNIRLQFGAAVAVVAAARWLGLTKSEVLPLLLATGLVICMEAVNTAVETAVDLATRDVHPLARLAKDVAAGAVLWSVVVAVAVGVWIFGPHLGRLPAAVMDRWYQQPLEVAVSTGVVLLLLVSGVKR